jgi:hypothetical protein
MSMDDRTKATVRALLNRHPRGYVAEAAGFAVTNTAAGLFRLLCLSILAEQSAPSGAAIEATRALFARHWDSAPELAKSTERDRATALARAGYKKADEASHRLADATKLIMDRYGGDLQRLRAAADGDTGVLHRLLREIPGMDEAGCAVFLREVQMFWPEAGPFLDKHAQEAAQRLELPANAEELLNDVARGGGQETLSWLVGALALTDVRNEYDQIRRDARR